MLKQATKQISFHVGRNFSTSKHNNFKVTVCGAGGGVGQPLSLLLKMNPLVTELVLYDLGKSLGVAVDLSHIDTPSVVKAFAGPQQMDEALSCADIVAISAGSPRKPGMDRNDLFNLNAVVVRDIATSISKNCPMAIVAIITNPVNTVVPIAAEVLKKNGTYDPHRLMGVTTLDIVRSRQFLGAKLGIDPKDLDLPVIGGHSGITILPVISQCKPPYKGADIEALTKRIQDAGTEVVKAKAGGGSATLSMGYAGGRIVNSLMRGLCGEPNVIECAYVESNVTEASFFSTPVVLGTNGIEKNLGMPELNDYEKGLLKALMPELLNNIKKGVEYIAGEKKC